MTDAVKEQTDEQSADAVEMLAQEAEGEQQQDARQEEATEGQWEDVEAQEEQARALAKMAVQGVEMAAGMVHGGHELDESSRRQGEEVLLPVARDFAGEVPEWLRPYMHYIGAGMWVGGVLVGAYRERRKEEAEAERREAEKTQGAADGV